MLLGDTGAHGVSAHVKLGEQIGGQYSHYLYYTYCTIFSILSLWGENKCLLHFLRKHLLAKFSSTKRPSAEEQDAAAQSFEFLVTLTVFSSLLVVW